MFEINLLSSDDGRYQNADIARNEEPEVIDLLSSSPMRSSPAFKQIQLRQDPPEQITPPRGQDLDFELSSSPILRAYDQAPLVADNTNEIRSSTETTPTAPILMQPDSQNFGNGTSPGVAFTQLAPPVSLQDSKTSKTSKIPKRAFRSSTEVIPSKPASNSKKFKAARSNSAPPAVKLVTDRKKACSGAKCSVSDVSGEWAELLTNALTALEIEVPCESVTAPSDLDGVAAIVTVSGEYCDEWDEGQHVFVKSIKHKEFMNMHIVVLQAEQLEILGKLDRQTRDLYFLRIRDFIAKSGQSGLAFDVVYLVPEVQVQLRKMMAAYDRRLRQRVMDHSHGREVTVEQPPQQHFFNDVQVRLQVENQIRAIYPRTKADAAETMANWIIDICFSRYRMRTDATLEGIGGSVKSKSTVPEITAEALAVIHGLPPRIASTIAGDMKSMGSLCALLATNDKQQMARVRYYGKGDWNESLVTFLTSGDPEKPIGQA